MNPARVLALVGPRCAGKTSLARSAAEAFGVPARDLDDLLSAEPGRAAASAGELLAELGEDAFRERETAALARFLAAGESAVLATGGGVVTRDANRRALAAHCLVVRLDAPAGVLAERLRADPAVRPSLTGGDPADELERVAGERSALYASVADLTLDASREIGLVLNDLLAAVERRDDGRFAERAD